MDESNKGSSSTVCEICQNRANAKGKRTKKMKKNFGKHDILFGPRGIQDGTSLTYYVDGQPKLSGVKKGLNILCDHCHEEVSFSTFEIHAGYGSRRNPYLQIRLTTDGPTLSEMAQELIKEQQDATICSSSEENEEVSEQHGDMICCEGSKNCFHQECLGLSSFPEGIWYCSNCKRESGTQTLLRGRRKHKTPAKYQRNRFERSKLVVNTKKQSESSCVLCRDSDYLTEGFGDRTVLLCDQCEKEFHVGCLRHKNMADLTELPEGLWFCSIICEEMRSKLKELVEQGPQQLPPIPHELKQKLINAEGSIANIQWQLINGKTEGPDKDELRKKAAAIFDECFNDIKDPDTEDDIITAMLYCKQINKEELRQDYEGMYCGILTVDSEVVSVAMFRIFGRDVAELPLVATSLQSQKKGYFQILFSCIEWLLDFLGVKNLILPATAEAETFWTNKFGFTKMTRRQLYNYRKDLQIVAFKDNSFFEKRLQA